MKTKAQLVTDLQAPPEDDRRSRMIRYSIAMTIRVACIVLAMFLQGWMMWVCFAGAILLPYFAVVIANAQGSAANGERPTVPQVQPLQITAEEFRVAPSQKIDLDESSR